MQANSIPSKAKQSRNNQFFCETLTVKSYSAVLLVLRYSMLSLKDPYSSALLF